MYGNSLFKGDASNEVLSVFDYIVVFSENKRIWRESVLTLFNALPRHLEGLRKTAINFT